MSLLSWLSRRAPDLETPPPINRLPAPANVQKELLRCEEDELLHVDEDGTISLDEIFCAIDYVSAAGDLTRRRITLLKLSRGPYAPILSAVCHERGAFRQFRCDRIEYFIEPDGEVISCADYFRDHVLVDLDELAPTDAQRAIPVAREIRDTLRPALSILVTAAQSDGEFHPEELDAICQFIENELMVGARCERFREQISIDVLDQLTEIVHRMRPQRSSLPGYITRILEFAPDERARFASALEHVIIADGKVDLDEQEILDELAVFATLESETRLRRLAGVS